LTCRRLGSARNVDKKRVANVDQDQADSICSSCSERTGSAIADKTQLGDSCFNLEASLFRHEVGVVEHVRNGADCDPSTPCHILNARCTWPGVTVIGVTGPSSRLRHAGRLYPDRPETEAVQAFGLRPAGCRGSPIARSTVDTSATPRYCPAGYQNVSSRRESPHGVSAAVSTSNVDGEPTETFIFRGSGPLFHVGPLQRYNRFVRLSWK
jgi:hypothetical protein